MGGAAPTQTMTAAEFLVWERAQPEKHEFHDGEVFAMAGGSARHNFLSAAVASELRSSMRGKPCHVLSSDQRIAAADGSRYVYADAVVVCEGARMAAGTSDVLENPSIVVEVLSPSTEAYDRGTKWEAYQRLASVTDYVLVSQNAARIEHYRRDAARGTGTDGQWRYAVAEAGGSLTLSNGAILAIDAIYNGAFDLAAG